MATQPPQPPPPPPPGDDEHKLVPVEYLGATADDISVVYDDERVYVFLHCGGAGKVAEVVASSYLSIKDATKTTAATFLAGAVARGEYRTVAWVRKPHVVMMHKRRQEAGAPSWMRAYVRTTQALFERTFLREPETLGEVLDVTRCDDFAHYYTGGSSAAAKRPGYFAHAGKVYFSPLFHTLVMAAARSAQAHAHAEQGHEQTARAPASGSGGGFRARVARAIWGPAAAPAAATRA
jgi:hypothetical protein